MNGSGTIESKSGIRLAVDTVRTDEAVEIRLNLQSETPRKCVLHWGLRRPNESGWTQPPESAWPEGTAPGGAAAVQTPFNHGRRGRIRIRLPNPADFSSLEFALFFPEPRNWDNNAGQNYRIDLSRLPGSRPGLQSALERALEGRPALFQRVFELEEGRLAAAVLEEDGRYAVMLLADVAGPLAARWGIARYSSYDWFLPPPAVRPPGTQVEQNSTQTPLMAGEDGIQRLRFEFPAQAAPLGLSFVLKQTATGRWLKDRGGNFYIPVSEAAAGRAALPTGLRAGVVEEIIQAETKRNSWTLMHRFNLCHDLLDRVQGDCEGLAFLFVWLRFSAIRQLSWQRNYNTKPRELSHAQDRLTQKLAELYSRERSSRALVRLMLTTVGRGGEGQQIRDEILNVMHRHHIKEVGGHFMEEWHQKLHNNTTPDDIVICEAYLEFLRSDGNQSRFYERLERGGVTRARLEGFERPIKTPPDFVPYLKEGLVADFEHFLKTLKSVHAGADLEIAIVNAQERLDAETRRKLWQLWEQRDDPRVPPAEFVCRISEVHRPLAAALAGGQNVRELLYLDLALEQLLRRVIERNLHEPLSGDQLTELIHWTVESFVFSLADGVNLFAEPELEIVLRHWARLSGLPRFSQDWSLHAKAAADRMGRILSDGIDRTYRLLQPKAELLGNAFHADAWAITLFSEEVVRGLSLGFVLGVLLRRLDPLLRRVAQLGDWQIVSPGQARGVVEVVDALRSVQGRSFGGPRVIVADRVAGDEELPEEAVAVIAPDVTDIVSHVAVRARNAHTLYATCYDAQTFQRLKGLQGRAIEASVTSSGDLAVTEIAGPGPVTRAKPAGPRVVPPSPQFSKYAITSVEFDPSRVGQKSLNQNWLRRKLPEWIRVPESAAIPFGVFEHVLNWRENKSLAARLRRLAQQAEAAGSPGPQLEEMRSTILQLQAPEDMAAAFAQVLRGSGLPAPQQWNHAWRCILRVWASKWNERAFLSRKRMGIAHENLFMAVLVQPIVRAEYAFVIHTANPFTGDRNELFAEIVLGLGETLVGNYPGRAFSFIANKQTGTHRLLSYPGKSVGLYGEGLMFRSDSNAEDLAGYAGAGLYDSVPLRPHLEVLLDYLRDPLVWDESFKHDLLEKIVRIGTEVETIFGGPQDIEGAVAKGQYFVVQSRPQAGLDHG